MTAFKVITNILVTVELSDIQAAAIESGLEEKKGDGECRDSVKKPEESSHDVDNPLIAPIITNFFDELVVGV